MQNKLFLFVIFIILLLTTCTVNQTTGRIIAYNETDKAILNLKVGNVFIGYLGAGMTTSVYFFIPESNAQISAEGFEPVNKQIGRKGTINLNLNYNYALDFYRANNSAKDYIYSCVGTEQNGINLETMK